MEFIVRLPRGAEEGIIVSTPLSVRWPLAVLVVTLAGCGSGHELEVPVPERSVVALPPNYGPSQPGYPGGAPGFGMPQPGVPQAGGGQAQALLQAVARAWNGVNTLSAKYDLRETKGSEVETAKVTFYFKKPGRYRYEVAQHSTSIKNGSTSTFDTRSRQITSRLGGIGSLVPLKGSLDDARSKSLRGWTLDQTDYATQLEQFFVPGAAVTGGEVPGVGLVLELQRPQRYNGSIEAMRATFDPQRLLPVSLEMTANGQLVYKKRFSALQVNPSIAADKFNL